MASASSYRISLCPNHNWSITKSSITWFGLTNIDIERANRGHFLGKWMAKSTFEHKQGWNWLFAIPANHTSIPQRPHFVIQPSRLQAQKTFHTWHNQRYCIVDSNQLNKNCVYLTSRGHLEENLTKSPLIKGNPLKQMGNLIVCYGLVLI